MPRPSSVAPIDESFHVQQPTAGQGIQGTVVNARDHEHGSAYLHRAFVKHVSTQHHQGTAFS